MIVAVLPRNAMQSDIEGKAYSADLRLRCGVQIGRMTHEELTCCAGRTSAKSLRAIARAELRRRDRLSA